MSFATAMLVFAIPSVSKDLPTIIKKEPKEKLSEEEAQKLIMRLEEIKEMDFDNMTRKEKRVLRKEVKAIENQLEARGGIYISVGALIIIILLLILLL